MEQVVNASDIPLQDRDDERAGRVRAQVLLASAPGAAEDVALQLSHTADAFTKPRQRQAFHQLRLQLKGEAVFEGDGVLQAGDLAFVPAGCEYGPLRVEADSAAVLLRFDAPGAGPAVAPATVAPSDPDVPVLVPPPGLDGSGTGMELLHPGAQAWAPDREPGVRRKSVGTFSPRQARVEFLQLDEGAAVQLAPQAYLFVLAGAGRVAGQAWRQHAAIRTDDRPGVLTALHASELLQVQLPPAS